MTQWLSELINELNRGCKNSPYIRDLHEAKDSLQTGRELCLILWPFISALPDNVTLVLNKLPAHMVATRKFFDTLKDEDRFYQKLFINQCLLAGIDEETVRNTRPDEQTRQLCDLMQRYCCSQDYTDGVLAIVTAELAATCFARHSLPFFESYFQIHADEERQVPLVEGLAWLRLHAKPHPKHAILLKRTVEALETNQPAQPTKKLPEPVEELVRAIHRFLRSDDTDNCQPGAPGDSSNTNGLNSPPLLRQA